MNVGTEDDADVGDVEDPIDHDDENNADDNDNDVSDVEDLIDDNNADGGYDLLAPTCSVVIRLHRGSLSRSPEQDSHGL